MIKEQAASTSNGYLLFVVLFVAQLTAIIIELFLRGDPIRIAEKIKVEVQERLEKAGVYVMKRVLVIWPIRRKLPKPYCVNNRPARFWRLAG